MKKKVMPILYDLQNKNLVAFRINNWIQFSWEFFKNSQETKVF